MTQQGKHCKPRYPFVQKNGPAGSDAAGIPGTGLNRKCRNQQQRKSRRTASLNGKLPAKTRGRDNKSDQRARKAGRGVNLEPGVRKSLHASVVCRVPGRPQMDRQDILISTRNADILDPNLDCVFQPTAVWSERTEMQTHSTSKTQTRYPLCGPHHAVSKDSVARDPQECGCLGFGALD